MTTEVVLDDNREVVLANQTVTASGSVIVTSYGGKETLLFVNVSGAVTGTTPTLTFTIQEVDPGDEITTLGAGVTGAAITATGTQIIEIPVSRSSFFKISWVVGGSSSPTFNAVYATLINKGAGTSVLYDNLGNSVFGTAGSPGSAVLTVQGVSGGQPSPVSGTVTGNQGTPNTLANKWPVQNTDGTNVQPTMDVAARKAFIALTDGTNTTAVKAASTAAAATDPSAVVALSPNTPLPTGSNTIGTVTAAQATAANLNATVVQGAGSGAAGTFWYVRVTDGTNTMPTGDAVARSIFQQVTDGTHGPVAVKAASTAAAAADPSFVVAFSPNSPLPTGSNVIGALSANQSVNVAQVGGNATSTAAAGVQKVGVVGNAGATLDGTLAAGTAPTDGLGALAQYNTTQPAPTNTQTLSLQSDQSGNLLEFPGVQTKGGAAWTSSTTINTLQFPTGTATVGAPLGASAVLVQLDQTTTLTAGAVTFQGTYDGSNWVTIPTAQVLNPQTFAQLTNPYTFVASTNQPFLILLQGFQQIRLNLTTVITGTGSVTPNWAVLSTISPVTAQGAPNTLANAWPHEITDGTHGPVAVKAASTAAVAADPSLVTAFSPNSPLPTGANTIGTVTAQQATAANLNATVVQGAGSGATGTFWYVRVTDGTNTMPTMDVVGRAGFQKITDGTNTAAVKAASTAAVATDPSLVIAFSPNSPLPTGSNTVGVVNQGTPASVANSWTTEITDGTHGPAAVKAASTAAAAADPSLVVALSPNTPTPGVADVTATGALGALNAAVTITTPGLAGVGFQLAAGTLIGTIVAEVSYDGGTTWNANYFDQNNKLTSIVFGSANTAQAGSLIGEAGAGQYRVRVSAYTSGTANITLRASEIADPAVLFAGVPGSTTQPPTTAQVAGWDGANLRVISTDSSGRQQVIGGAASGSAVAGNPVLVGGSDGANARSLLTDTSGRPNVVGAAAAGAAPAGNPVLLGVVAPSGNMENVVGGSDGEMGVAIMGNDSSVQSNATVTTSGSTTITKGFYGVQQINLIVNVKNAPTGTTPTITYTIQEIDPGDGATTMGNSSSTQSITAAGVYTASLTTSSSGAIKVSWTVTGTSPSFTGVYATVVSKSTPATQTVNFASSGATTGVSFGRVLYGGSSGVLTSIRATTYTEQTTNFTGSVKSSSANDASAGTGARTMTITYLDQTGAGPNTETVTFNGTTAVNLVNTNHCFIEKMAVASIGTTGSNAGTLSLFTGAAGAGTTVGSIGFGTTVSTLGDNTTLWAHHYTPLNKTSTLYLLNAGTTGNQTASVALRTNSNPTVATTPENQVSDFVIVAASSDSVSRTLSQPIKITGPARTTAYVVSNGTNTNFFAGFDYSDQ